jgi:pimeloyl-ACP methyl ester carboxylesterase
VADAAKAADTILKRWGIPGSRVNLIGHSFGGFLCDRLAAGLTGGVNRIVAIDPADDIVTNVNFAARSRYAVAFIASQYSTPEHALTADACFKMNVGAYDSIFTHMAAADFYAAMLASVAHGTPDNISRLFSPAAPTHPWVSGSGYEGTVVGRMDGFDWATKSLTYKIAGGKTVKVLRG